MFSKFINWIKKKREEARLRDERPCDFCINQLVVGNYGPCYTCDRTHSNFEEADTGEPEVRKAMFGEE